MPAAMARSSSGSHSPSLARRNRDPPPNASRATLSPVLPSVRSRIEPAMDYMPAAAMAVRPAPELRMNDLREMGCIMALHSLWIGTLFREHVPRPHVAQDVRRL